MKFSKNGSHGVLDPMAASATFLDRYFEKRDQEIKSSIGEDATPISSQYREFMRVNLFLDAIKRYGEVVYRGVSPEETIRVKNMVVEYLSARFSNKKYVYIPEDVEPEDKKEVVETKVAPTTPTKNQSNDAKGTAMITLTIHVVDEDPITFKNPKSFKRGEGKNGDSTFVVTEDDGITENTHTFNWNNILYITEKKHKAET